MAIPIRNIYLLLVYAWNRLEEGEAIKVGTTDISGTPANLFARVLIAGMNRVLKDGLDRGYEEVSEDMQSVQGRVSLWETERRFLVKQGRIHCTHDELRHDVLHNRILKKTVSSLARVRDLDEDLRSQLNRIHSRLPPISDIRITPSMFRRIQIHRNNGFYRFLLNICALVSDSLVPADGGQEYTFSDFVRDKTRMPYLFQEFVFNFYRIEQSKYRVSRDRILWDAEAVTTGALAWLPTMNTDITLRSENRTIVIDTKYYEEALIERFDTKKFRPDNLYQLFSYMQNLRTREGAKKAIDGVLLYPCVSYELNEVVKVSGHLVRVATIRLDQNWDALASDLKQLVNF